ncbi:MAG: DinB family protein [Chloroflexi bacterium]|nr:MAG: DinB family protein [Chloroflexota bacterium]
MTTVEQPFEKVRRKLVVARIEFMAQLAKFSEEELVKAPAAGGWSALQLAHHLYIADGLFLEQMQSIQEQDNPLIEDSAMVAPRKTEEAETPASLDAVLAGMAARREEIFEYLSTLSVDTWERPFRHPAWGQSKFYQLTNLIAAHDHLHTQQLADLKAIL